MKLEEHAYCIYDYDDISIDINYKLLIMPTRSQLDKFVEFDCTLASKKNTVYELKERK